jgi:ribosomal-protein-alanine N-acetyltransferase
VQAGEATAPRVLDFAQALADIRAFGPCVLAGTGAPAAKDALGAGFALSAIRHPDALFVARLAALRPLPLVDLPPPAPLYLRAPDAKLPAGREMAQLFAGDAAMLAGLHAQSFEKAWDAGALAALLEGPGVFAFHAASGFVLARAAAGEAEILTLAVTPAARRRGLGRVLMQEAAAHAAMLGAQTMFLEVGSENAAALALYHGLGFEQAGSRKGYYIGVSGTGGDALLLKAALPLTGKLP